MLLEVKVKYIPNKENGRKMVSESYLVEERSYAEAEARIEQELKEFVVGDLNIASIASMKVVRYDYIIDASLCDDFPVFVCTAVFTCNKEDGGKKKGKNTLLLRTSCMEDAINEARRNFEQILEEYNLVSVVQTKIVNIFLQRGHII